MTAEVEEVGDALVAAIEAGDVERIRHDLYHPDAVIWHNFDDATQTVEGNLRTLRWLHRHVSDLRYDDVRRQRTPSGYVQQHCLRGVLDGGEMLAVRACLVVTVAEGRITRIDEYLDTRSAGGLIRT